MAFTSSAVAIGTGIAAAAGATAAAVRAAKQRTKPKQSAYGAQDDVYGLANPEAQAVRQLNIDAARNSEQQALARLGPRPNDWRATAWDAKAQEIAKAAQARVASINEHADRTEVQKTGYEVATEPLANMQAQGAQVYGNTLAQQSQAVLDAQAMGSAADARAASAATDQQRSVIGAQDVSNVGAGMLASYQPGQVSTAASNAALNQAAQANLGAARSGGALGLRNALNANSQAGVGLAAQTSAQRAAEEERYLAAQVGQANLDRDALLSQRNLETGMQLEADEAQRQRVLQQQEMNYGISQAALGARMGALDSQSSQAIQREQLAAAGLDSIRGQQLEADINYDTRRQQEGQRRSDRLWGLAGGLAGMAGSAFSSLGKK